MGIHVFLPTGARSQSPCRPSPPVAQPEMSGVGSSRGAGEKHSGPHSPGCSSFCSGDAGVPLPLFPGPLGPTRLFQVGQSRCHHSDSPPREELQTLGGGLWNEAGLTSLSKSWSGSDILLRGTATPCSDPPMEKESRHLREKSPEPQQARPSPSDTLDT